MADVFIAHFGPAGVTAAKLRGLGVLRGKIATIFHGIDISSREVLSHYTPEYQQLFRRGDHDAAHQRTVGRSRLKSMGCPPEYRSRAWASTLTRFTAHRRWLAEDAAGDDFRRAPDREKGMWRLKPVGN